jgi:proliferating cell nuclear antigen
VFSIGLPNAGYAASLFRAVAAVVEEATFRVTGDSMGLVSMDPSHVSLVDFELQKWAGEFRADGETRMTIDLRELLRFLRRAGRGESLTLEYDEGERRLSILLEDPTGSRVRRYQLNTLEWESEPITMPSLSFTGTRNHILGRVVGGNRGRRPGSRLLGHNHTARRGHLLGEG